VVVPAKKEKRKSKEKDKEPIEGPWVNGRGAILMDSTSVVVLKTETGISRVIGPGNEAGKSNSGVSFTFYAEQVDSIIDLRPQMRTEMIKAQTRDGIGVEVRVSVFFTLKGTKARRSIDITAEKPHPFTWRQASVREAFHNKRIEPIEGKPGETQQTEWSDRVMQIAIAELRQLIARHSLDYLTAPLLSDRHPRFELRRELLGIVQDQLDASNIIQSEPEASGESKRSSGIEVRFIAVSLIWPPPPVVEQRIEAWKNEWSKKEIEVMGRAKAQALIMKEQARATAQGELTARINDALQAAKDSGTTSSDLVALRFLEVMDKMAKDPTTRALLTLDSLNMLNQLRDMLKSDGADKS
jgi:regulator of protease activity HflC (stomatin/prohibitin superfamily)